MNISTWLLQSMKLLGDAGVDSPRRDALVLLEDTLEKERAWVLAHHDYEIPDDLLDHVDALVARRLQREPLAYIRGKAWFYGRFFSVNPDVLIPRPESEAIIDSIKRLQPATMIDVGTGSGCLAVTAALEVPGCRVMATDVSPEAINIARSNAYRYDVRVDLRETYLLEGLLEKPVDLVVANLPYVPDGHVTSPEIEAEPKLALFAGIDGMDIYQSFWAQLSTTHHKPAHVITESLESQHHRMNELAIQSGFHTVHSDTLVQVFARDL